MYNGASWSGLPEVGICQKCAEAAKCFTDDADNDEDDNDHDDNDDNDNKMMTMMIMTMTTNNDDGYVCLQRESGFIVIM